MEYAQWAAAPAYVKVAKNKVIIIDLIGPLPAGKALAIP